MARPSRACAPGFAFYAAAGGRLDEERFARALPLAMARLRALAGDGVPERCADAYMRAACALVDSGDGAVSVRTPVASETVGATSVRYAVPGSASQSDYEAVLPWLAGTGLLCRAVTMRG